MESKSIISCSSKGIIIIYTSSGIALYGCISFYLICCERETTCYSKGICNLVGRVPYSYFLSRCIVETSVASVISSDEGIHRVVEFYRIGISVWYIDGPFPCKESIWCIVFPVYFEVVVETIGMEYIDICDSCIGGPILITASIC